MMPISEQAGLVILFVSGIGLMFTLGVRRDEFKVQRFILAVVFVVGALTLDLCTYSRAHRGRAESNQPKQQPSDTTT
jgi:hypothetical protein